MEESPLANQLYSTLVVLLFFMGIFGVLYPWSVTFLLQNFFPYKANGSLIVINNEIKGSELLGQPFVDSKHFWSRPSMTKQYAYNALDSGGSNWAATNPMLVKNMHERIDLLNSSNVNHDKIPVDLVTGSGSGLDPHISLASAYFQVPRIAKARQIEESEIQNLIERTMEERQLKIFGEPRLNVVKLNLKLEEHSKT